MRGCPGPFAQAHLTPQEVAVAIDAGQASCLVVTAVAGNVVKGAA